MEYFFNRLFYCICNWWQPIFRLLLKIKCSRNRLIKNRYIKVKPNGDLDYSRFISHLNRVKVPFSLRGLNLIFLSVSIPIGFFVSHILASHKIIAESLGWFIVFLPLFILYFNIEYKDKYQHYFTFFEKDSKKTRIKWNIITIFILILVVIVAILLFKLNAFCFPKKTT